MEEYRVIFALIALASLGFSFYTDSVHKRRIAAVGWAFVGLYFFLDTPHYVEISDPVLIVMSAATLPLGISLALFEVRRDEGHHLIEPLEWLKGAVFWSALPYLALSWIPTLSVGLVWLTAVQAVLFLRLAGVADLRVGQAMVEYADGTTAPFNEFQGSPWFYLEPLGEGGFFIPILSNDGSPAGVSMILACSALQSMIVFVGALVALQRSPWKDRIKGLIITVPVIHLLNIFRNAGIIYLDIAYRDWNWLGLSMFDFSHTYVAKVGSLAAMFLMAVVLFEILPELHHNILRLMDVFNPKRAESTTSEII